MINLAISIVSGYIACLALTDIRAALHYAPVQDAWTFEYTFLASDSELFRMIRAARAVGLQVLQFS